MYEKLYGRFLKRSDLPPIQPIWESTEPESNNESHYIQEQFTMLKEQLLKEKERKAKIEREFKLVCISTAEAKKKVSSDRKRLRSVIACYERIAMQASDWLSSPNTEIKTDNEVIHILRQNIEKQEERHEIHVKELQSANTVSEELVKSTLETLRIERKTAIDIKEIHETQLSRINNDINIINSEKADLLVKLNRPNHVQPFAPIFEKTLSPEGIRAIGEEASATINIDNVFLTHLEYLVNHAAVGYCESLKGIFTSIGKLVPFIPKNETRCGISFCCTYAFIKFFLT